MGMAKIAASSIIMLTLRLTVLVETLSCLAISSSFLSASLNRRRTISQSRLVMRKLVVLSPRPGTNVTWPSIPVLANELWEVLVFIGKHCNQHALVVGAADVDDAARLGESWDCRLLRVSVFELDAKRSKRTSEQDGVRDDSIAKQESTLSEVLDPVSDSLLVDA